MILTHCGKLGDFIYAWPIASWLYKTAGHKIHFVLPRCFKPFTQIESLLKLQDFFGQLTLVDHKVKTYGCGGQPYRFDPADYGIEDKYYNIGFNTWPNKYVTEYQAEEHGFGYDKEWKLNLGQYNCKPEEIVVTEQLSPWSARINLNESILFNARRLASAKKRCCFFSGMAAILYFAQVKFDLFREPWQPDPALYFPDSSRYELVNLPHGNIPAEIKRDELLTQWLVIKNKLADIFFTC